MRFSIKTAENADGSAWHNVDGSSESVATYLAQGVEFGPVRVTKGGCDQSCVIGFPLPQTEMDAERYKRLLAGLGVVYGVGHSSTGLATWTATSSGQAQKLEGSLNEGALNQLFLLGEEMFSHPQRGVAEHSRSFIRSRVRAHKMQSLTLRDGNEVILGMLDNGTAVYCPVHVDTMGIAEVVGKGEHKGVQCPACQRTYWTYRPATGNFNHFRKVFGDLHAHEQKQLEDGSTSGRQFTLIRERYLPALAYQEGFTVVRSPKGTGKTEALEKLIEQCKWEGKSVLLIGHRRTLLLLTAERLKLIPYLEPEYGEDDGEPKRKSENEPSSTLAPAATQIPPPVATPNSPT